MGSVTYRKVGSRWHIRFREQGNEKVKTYDGSLPEYAIKRKSQWFKEEWERGYFHPFRERQKETDLSSAIERFCASKRRRGDWNKKTAKISKERLEQAAKFVGPKQMLGNLQHGELQQWIDSLDGSPYTKKSYRSTLNTFLKWCHNHKYTSHLLQVELPEDDRKKIKGVRTSEFISLEDLQSLVQHYQINSNKELSEYIRSSIPDIWQLMFWQLLTVEDVLFLEHQHVLSDSKFIILQGNSETERKLPVVPPARKILEKYTDLNTASEQSIFRIKGVHKIRSPYRKTMNARFPDRKANLAQLKHGGIIHYLKLGKPIQYISRLARHPSIEKTVQQYKSYIPDLTNKAFEDIQLDGRN